MEVQLKAINGLKNNFIAYNYQLRNNKNVVNGGVLQPLILTTIVEKKEEKKEEKNKKKKEEEVASQV